jgi:hypothetical protein
MFVKSKKSSALKPLLTPAFIKGRICTLDAMHTQAEMCTKMERYGGTYVLIAKENQSTLAAFFTDPPVDWQSQRAETWHTGHGRLEHRQIMCSTDLNEWFAKRWPGVAQVFRLERTTTILKTGKVRRQIV